MKLQSVILIDWHVSGEDWERFLEFEDKLFDVWGFDTGMALGTAQREWQLDLMKPRDRSRLLVDLWRAIGRNAWPYELWQKTLHVYFSKNPHPKAITQFI